MKPTDARLDRARLDRPPLGKTDDGERSACGVGFVASRRNAPGHDILRTALHALACVEHRGACGADRLSSDGAGMTTDIPFSLLGYEPGSIAVATLFLMSDEERRKIALRVFEETFAFFNLRVAGYRTVPTRPEVLGGDARASMPVILHAFIERPPHTRTEASFETQLYLAKQKTRTTGRAAGISQELYFTSLSSRTITYKALTPANRLADFYPDLKNPQFKTRFAMFHRRFSTNTRTSWDKAQPFRLIAHNGEINTVAGNRSWSHSREQDLGLPPDELLTRDSISDSGNVNEMVEALRHRSGIPHIEEILAIMMPPGTESSDYYRFWGRAMEPWDGPAFVTYCDGRSIGARLDRNGFRPCRWTSTRNRFYLASEAGIFSIDEADVLEKGTLEAGTGLRLDLTSGVLHFRDPSRSRENRGATLDPRLVQLIEGPVPPVENLRLLTLFGVTTEERDRLILPMVAAAKEPIGSMGDTARAAILSDQPRSFFDYFFQDFAQVTNPPVDHLREKLVTDLSTSLGKRPNIFQPKELLPLATAIELDGPVLSLAQMATIRGFGRKDAKRPPIKPFELSATLPWRAGSDGRGRLERRLRLLGKSAVEAARRGNTVVILTDRFASQDSPPIPSLLALRAVVTALNRSGRRLDCAVIVDTADARTAHHIAALIGFGATAVCPYLALEIARSSTNRSLADITDGEREDRLIKALHGGLLKVMSKMGISVVRSYQSSKLFTAIGLGPDLLSEYFRGLSSPLGGLTIDDLEREIVDHAAAVRTLPADQPLPSLHLLREPTGGRDGETHAMTSVRSKLVHAFTTAENDDEARAAYREYLAVGESASPLALRHLVRPRGADTPLALADVAPRADVLARFGSGAMSFGALSAESQRDIIHAMRRVGGRSASGEGGENPYYFKDGTTATVKQVASGRFGVTAEYLVSGGELEIKIAQGAKPGEGGQLMGVKVNAEIARARHASPGVDLISPAPQHDIYSIEDLKELIYELRQIAPTARIAVKLVAGARIGTIAAGVVKAGADVIQISGGDGGTGAATISSMRHAGLPWELGLTDVHATLLDQGLRRRVVLRVDGGLATGADIVLASALGAEEFGFGKLLLIAEGCIMARVCEKNTCPRGIATHDPKYKAKYVGNADLVVRLLEHLADDVREHLARMGLRSLDELTGRAGLLVADPRHADLVARRGLDLAPLLTDRPIDPSADDSSLGEGVSDTNQSLVGLAEPAWRDGEPVSIERDVVSTERALLARLSGVLAERSRDRRLADIASGADGAEDGPYTLPPGTVNVRLTGSAGQGFAVFTVEGLDVRLEGEANDSVAKGMSGGRVVVVPSADARFVPERSAIIGNCGLYGATGGTLFVHGAAGDRFAVRNSGATAVVEAVGLHACEYMTGGTVVILGDASHNVGAGMTGGVIYARTTIVRNVNPEYLEAGELGPEHEARLRSLLMDYLAATGSRTAATVLASWDRSKTQFAVLAPR